MNLAILEILLTDLNVTLDILAGRNLGLGVVSSTRVNIKLSFYIVNSPSLKDSGKLVSLLLAPEPYIDKAGCSCFCSEYQLGIAALKGVFCVCEL